MGKACLGNVIIVVFVFVVVVVVVVDVSSCARGHLGRGATGICH